MKNKFLKGLVASFVLAISGFANAGLITLDSDRFGWYESDGSQNGVDKNICAGCFGEYRNWLGFDLSTVTDTILSAELRVFSTSDNDDNQSIEWYEILTSYNDLGQVSGLAIYNDLGDGQLFSSGIANSNQWNSFTMNTAGILSLNSLSGTKWAIGGKNLSNQDAFGWTYNYNETHPNIQLVITTGSVDVPEPSTLAVFALGLMGLASRKFKKQA